MFHIFYVTSRRLLSGKVKYFMNQNAQKGYDRKSLPTRGASARALHRRSRPRARPRLCRHPVRLAISFPFRGSPLCGESISAEKAILSSPNSLSLSRLWITARKRPDRDGKQKLLLFAEKPTPLPPTHPPQRTQTWRWWRGRENWPSFW